MSRASTSVYGPTTPGLALDTILTPEGQAAIPSMVPLCLLTQNEELHAIAGPLVGRFLTANPADTAPWSTLLEQNTPGALPIEVPMLVAQGANDDLVKPATTAAYVAHLCATGEHVDAQVYADVDHGTVAYRALPAVLTLFGDALAGRQPPATCSSTDGSTGTTGSLGTTIPGSTGTTAGG